VNERQTIDAGGLDEVKRLRERVAELEANVSWYGGVRLRDDQHGEPLRTIFENARGAMFVSDEQGRCVDVNPAACAMTGYAREELLHTDLGLIWSKASEESRDGRVEPAWNGSPVPEWIIRRKDGVELWVEVTTIPFTLNSKELALEILRDVTNRRHASNDLNRIQDQLEKRIEKGAHDLEMANRKLKKQIEERRRAEAELKQTKEYLENIIENSVDAIGIVDREGRFILWNRRAVEIYGYHSDDLAGKSSFDLYADRGELERIVADASFYLPSGCPKCGGTGYSGRMALFELIPFTPGVQNIVASEGTLEEKLSRLMEEDFYSAAQSVQEMLRRGMVTYEDVAPFFR